MDPLHLLGFLWFSHMFNVFLSDLEETSKARDGVVGGEERVSWGRVSFGAGFRVPGTVVSRAATASRGDPT